MIGKFEKFNCDPLNRDFRDYCENIPTCEVCARAANCGNNLKNI